MRKRKGLFYGAENKNGHQCSPKRSACGIAWKEGFGISEISAGRQKESGTAWLYSYYGKNFVKTIVNAGKKFGKLEVCL